MTKQSEAEKQITKLANDIRKLVNDLEQAGSPLAREPMVQSAKELANYAEFAIKERQKRR